MESGFAPAKDGKAMKTKAYPRPSRIAVPLPESGIIFATTMMVRSLKYRLKHFYRASTAEYRAAETAGYLSDSKNLLSVLSYNFKEV